VPDAIDLAGYRIVQEALTNVVRHAGAQHAAVSLRYGPDEVDLEIVDDGTGPSPGPRANGQGLRGMRERAVLIGGTLTYGAREGGGFRVTAVLPARQVDASEQLDALAREQEAVSVAAVDAADADFFAGADEAALA
jgi:glucose-6-phosphate-specific signal transduction histidine kinase